MTRTTFPRTASAYRTHPRAGTRFNTLPNLDGGFNAFPSGAAAPPPFVPTDIANLVLWHDMQDPASFVQAGTVTSITNKASAVAWTEATNPPAYDATGLNGFPCMAHDGTNDIIRSSEAAVAAAMAGPTSFSLYLVMQADTDDRADCFFGVGNTGISSNRTRLFGKSVAGSGSLNVFAIDNSGVSTNSNFIGFSGSTDTLSHIFGWREGSGTATLKLEKDAQPVWTDMAFVPGTQTVNQCALGARPDSGPDTFADGKIGEVLIYSRKLSDSEDSQVVDYLFEKWSFVERTAQIYIAGDSIGRGDFAASQTTAVALTGVTGNKVNQAVNGATLSDIADGVSAQKANIQVLYQGGNSKQIVVCCAGSNDLFGAGTAAEAFADHVTMAAFAHAIGMRYVAVNTRYRNPLDLTNGAANIVANLKADTLKGLMDAEMLTPTPRFDGYVDMLQGYIDAYGADGWDAGAFADDTHDNNTGQQTLVALFTPVINAVLADT